MHPMTTGPHLFMTTQGHYSKPYYLIHAWGKTFVDPGVWGGTVPPERNPWPRTVTYNAPKHHCEIHAHTRSPGTAIPRLNWWHPLECKCMWWTKTVKYGPHLFPIPAACSSMNTIWARGTAMQQSWGETTEATGHGTGQAPAAYSASCGARTSPPLNRKNGESTRLLYPRNKRKEKRDENSTVVAF